MQCLNYGPNTIYMTRVARAVPGMVFVSKHEPKNGWLSALVKEVVENGYKYDLCTQCGKNDKCKHNVNKSTQF